MSSILLSKTTAPPTPPAGKVVIYVKSDGRVYWKDENGTETPFKTVGAGTGDLMSDGSVALISDWDVGPYNLTMKAVTLDIPDGTPPMSVTSTTVVTNLNADLLDGQEGNFYASVTYVDNAVAGLYDHKGGYDASTNTPDLDTAPAGIKKGDAYTVSVAGTFYAVNLEAGDVLIADQDDPTASSEWTIVNRNIDSSAFATSAQGSVADSAMQDLVDDTAPQLGGALDGQGNDLNNLGVLFLTGQATDEADVSGKGQVWTTNDSPPRLMYTDDAGNQHQLAPQIESIITAIGDEGTPVVIQTGATEIPCPYDFTVTEVRAHVNVASTSGVVTVDIKENGVSILSTLITIDQDEKSSFTAATPAVVSDAFIANDADITYDVTTAGTGAVGLKVVLIGYKTN